MRTVKSLHFAVKRGRQTLYFQGLSAWVVSRGQQRLSLLLLGLQSLPTISNIMKLTSVIKAILAS
jgi:hypothetical protein